MTDQQRFDTLSAGGLPLLRTPNIDKLVGGGITFSNACTPRPVCGPARAAMFTGRYPPGCGVVQNWAGFNGTGIHLAEHLQRTGDETAMVGKLQFMPHQKHFGLSTSN